jgi:uncharacterized protein (DUF1330 family)
MQVSNAVYPEPAQAMGFFSAPEAGAFVMVNLLRFKAHAEYADGSDAQLTGREAYARYADGVRPLIEALGGRIVYAGAVTGLMIGQIEDPWDMVALAEYPSLAAFQRMAMSPEMGAIEHHRSAGLAGQLNIQTQPVAS